MGGGGLMPYLNIDDGMGEHPKVEALSDAAFRLHICAMLYCAKYGTDGVVSLARARRLTDSAGDGVAAELVKAGVWHDLGEGCGTETCRGGQERAYVVHDYLEWNHSAHWWAKRREEQKKRVRDWRASRKRPDPDGVT